MSSLFPKELDTEIASYEAQIALQPLDRSLYWTLGILYLLDERDEEAQFLWMSVLNDADAASLELWRYELFQSIIKQAESHREQGELEEDYLLCRHAHAIIPENLSHSFLVLGIALSQDEIEEAVKILVQVTESLNLYQDTDSYAVPILELLEQLLSQIPLCPELISFVDAVAPYFRSYPLSLLTVILPESIRIAYSIRSPTVACRLLNAYLSIDPLNVEVLGHLSSFYHNAGEYHQGTQLAKQRLELATDLPEKIFSSHLILRGLLSAGGYWNDAVEYSKQHINLLSDVIKQVPENLSSVQVLRLFTSSYYLPYLEDGFQSRQILNQISQFSQSCVESYTQLFCSKNEVYSSRKNVLRSSSKLRIGYLSHCTYQHSVGWLARWLIQHHDRSKFELYGYFINDRPYDGLQQWYINQFDHVSSLEKEFGQDTQGFARKINEDGIDILIDLDSITLDITCEILAMKPAPIQVTWLGWDAIGMDAIDYFIADPYVLPDHAQDYYTEKIWRLPETYLAVDGFEVAVPTLKRSDLKLPENAVTFLTAQRGYKRHRDTAILQMKIIAGVPDAYLLIKGFADDQAIQNFFYEIADEVGVSRDRLRFLGSDPSEAVHRANLRIADVVLDTYPYNGATTTMETLWMEVPIVTRVGEQFAARNSYTMMMNAGITEGIAWSAEEYVEWGIKLGTDAKLRQEVSWKLRESKKTSPLWDGKKFTRQMEDAYQQMWKTYVESNS